MTEINLNRAQIIIMFRIYKSKSIMFSDFSEYNTADLKGPKVKYKLHYGRCTGPLFRDATLQ